MTITLQQIWRQPSSLGWQLQQMKMASQQYLLKILLETIKALPEQPITLSVDENNSY
ncbi:MAG: hypothetical protein IPJ39_22370 [Saprospiraceae bacterium]|nr:hypothetical protein [Saprospiraceae bacterium]